MKNFIKTFLVLCVFMSSSWAQDLKVGDPAPLFKVLTDENKTFELSTRKGEWTVLYFYPKAGTPGCTNQAKSFKEFAPDIEKLGVKVYGISTDSVKDQEEFKRALGLKFTLLADEDMQVVKLYGSKIPFLNYSKRWSFIIDPELVIRFIERDVEAKEDGKNILEELKKLKKP